MRKEAVEGRVRHGVEAPKEAEVELCVVAGRDDALILVKVMLVLRSDKFGKQRDCPVGTDCDFPIARKVDAVYAKRLRSDADDWFSYGGFKLGPRCAVLAEPSAPCSEIWGKHKTIERGPAFDSSIGRWQS